MNDAFRCPIAFGRSVSYSNPARIEQNMQPINLCIANSAGSLNARLDIVTGALDSSPAHASTLLNANDIDVLIVDAPDETIPEWGVGGYTWGPHVMGKDWSGFSVVVLDR
jgi:hypothetical protein